MDEQNSVASPTSDVIQKIQELGLEKQIGLGSIILAILGFFTPLATAQTGGFFGASSEVSYGLSQAGFSGVVVVALALALGAAVFYLPLSRRNNVVYYGVAAACLGTVLSLWLISLSLPTIISAVGHLAPGFYFLTVSFGLSTYVSAIRCYRFVTP